MPSKRDRVFISYRQDDAGSEAALLVHVLQRGVSGAQIAFGPRISPGTDFARQIHTELSRTKVMVAVLGPQWVGFDGTNRRIDIKTDWMRLELAYGLRTRDVTVIPVLVRQLTNESLRNAALPRELKGLLKLHSIVCPDINHPPVALIESVATALRSTSKSSPIADSPSLGSAVEGPLIAVILHVETGKLESDQGDATTDSISGARKREIVELLAVGTGIRVVVSRSNDRPNDGHIIGVELLTCQGAVIVVDKVSLTSDVFRRRARLLDWRCRLGMPLAVILLDGITVDALPADLQLLPKWVIDGSHGSAAAVCDRLVRDLAAEVEHRKRAQADPVTQWALDVAMLIQEVPDAMLARLAERLQIGDDALYQAADPRATIAAALFNADLDSAWQFLQETRAVLHEFGAPPDRTRRLATRAMPIWVDLDAGRALLDATRLPYSQRRIAAHLPQLTWAEHATTRASAGTYMYPAAQLPSVAGEHVVDELVDRHDKTLRQYLNLMPGHSPAFIREALIKSYQAVFALFDAKHLSWPDLRDIVEQLSARFPGITFVLVSDKEDAHAHWRFFPPLKVAIGPLDPHREREVEIHVWRTESLIEKP